MTITHQDPGQIELNEQMPIGQKETLITSFSIYLFSLVAIIVIIPYGYLIVLNVLIIPLIYGLYFIYTSYKSTKIVIDKKNENIIVQTINLLGKRNSSELIISKIKSVSTIKDQHSYAFGLPRRGLPAHYFSLNMKEGSNFKIWFEKKRFLDNFLYYSNYLSDEEKKIPEKISKFLNIPLTD